ncbi:histidine phosphatase family protein [Cronobacter dublinensis]|nr:histidine phosphatase family protein [Cronobacter dublinensis]
MKIILMRHGRPLLSQTGALKASDMRGWIADYDRADIGSDAPPAASRELAEHASVVISSDLPRALSSLAALGREPAQTDALYREAYLPVFRLGGLRMSPFTWAAIFRGLWLCGIAGEAEPLREAKRRAMDAADSLIRLSSTADDTVLLMGHGIMNRLIAGALRAKGWRETVKPGKGYWSAGVYQSPD